MAKYIVESIEPGPGGWQPLLNTPNNLTFATARWHVVSELMLDSRSDDVTPDMAAQLGSASKRVSKWRDLTDAEALLFSDGYGYRIVVDPFTTGRK